MLERHIDAHEVMENLLERVNNNLEVKPFQSDESCLGLFSLNRPRDDGLPSLFLHTNECWRREGHFCPDLPSSTDDDYANEDVIPNYEMYDPTLHSIMDKLIVKDCNMAGYTVNWTRIVELLNEW